MRLNIKAIDFRSLFELKDYIIPYIKYLIYGGVFIIIASISYVQVPKLAGEFLNIISKIEGDTAVTMAIITKTSLLLALMLLINAISKILYTYYFFLFSEKSIIRIKQNLFSILVKKDFSFYDTNKIGNLISIINIDSVALKTALSANITTILYKPIIIVFCFVNMILINIKLTLCLLMVLPLLMYIVLNQVKKIKRITRVILEQYSKTNNILQESLSAIRTIKICSKENFEIDKYDSALNDVFKQALKAQRISIFIELIIIISSIIAVSIVISIAISLMRAGEFNGGEFVSFIIFTFIIINSLSAVLTTLNNFQQSINAADRIHNIMTEGIQEPLDNSKNDCSIEFKKSIKLKNVNFAYPTRPENNIFQNLDFIINKADKIGIVGVSGVGKSSLIQILMRFYPIADGSITLDERGIEEYELKSFRKIFAYIPQDIKLFSGSIRDNVRYGKEDATNEEIIRACKISLCYDFIKELPEQLDTFIGDNGVALSGGQRQRIAIARAVLSNAQIFILDEATSALDLQTEEIINKQLLSNLQGKTLIVLSHKYNLISCMDSVYEVKNNTLVKIRLPITYSEPT